MSEAQLGNRYTVGIQILVALLYFLEEKRERRHRIFLQFLFIKYI